MTRPIQIRMGGYGPSTTGFSRALNLIGDRLTLRFNPLSDHELDVARFRALIAACRRHPHPDPNDCTECAARLTQALDLIRGDFLDQFSLPNSLQFDEWLLLQRQQFQIQVTAVLEQLAAFHEHTGQLAQAEKTTRRLLEYDPLNESAYRQLMRVLAQADQLDYVIQQVGAENVAAFIAEPVVGATIGAAPATTGYFERIREICDRHDILFIADEVMTGFGRTGKKFGIDHWDALPDLVACAKGISGGYSPLGAVIVRPEMTTGPSHRPGRIHTASPSSAASIASWTDG